MHEPKDSLPVLVEAPGITLRTVDCAGMTIAFARYAKGTDFTPALKGLKHDMCHCPHWGYVLTGALHIRHVDGREEIARAGEVWHAEPGHTAWCDEDTEMIDVSPSREFHEVVNHVLSQAGG